MENMRSPQRFTRSFMVNQSDLAELSRLNSKMIRSEQVDICNDEWFWCSDCLVLLTSPRPRCRWWLPIIRRYFGVRCLNTLLYTRYVCKSKAMPIFALSNKRRAFDNYGRNRESQQKSRNPIGGLKLEKRFAPSAHGPKIRRVIIPCK